MQRIDQAARIAGAMYVLAILVGPFSLLYVPNTLVVTGNATATANNILAHEMLLRLGIAGELLNGLVTLALVLALYRLLEGVNRSLAVLMVILGGLMVTPIFFMNSLNWAAALILVHGGDYLAAFAKPQLYALAMLFLRIHAQGNLVNGIFWGLWLFPFGTLVFRSGFLPRFLGVWLILGGIAWLILSFAGLLFPQYRDTLFTVLQPAFFGEIAIMLWLLIRGAKVKPLAGPPRAA